jgi:hypothetical protein
MMDLEDKLVLEARASRHVMVRKATSTTTTSLLSTTSNNELDFASLIFWTRLRVVRSV